MQRVVTIIGMWVGWFGAMLIIGIVLYHVGKYGLPALTFTGIGPDSRWGIIFKAFIAATFLSLWYDLLKHRQRIRG